MGISNPIRFSPMNANNSLKSQHSQPHSNVKFGNSPGATIVATTPEHPSNAVAITAIVVASVAATLVTGLSMFFCGPAIARNAKKLVTIPIDQFKKLGTRFKPSPTDEENAISQPTQP